MGKRRIETSAGPVSALIDGAEDSAVTIVLGHGAGAPMDSPFMAHMARRLAEGHRVCRFNFPYMEQGRKAPDRAPVLEAAFASVVASVGSSGAVVVGGKSMGGRIASQAVAAGMDADGLLFFGYPLHPPGRPDRIRDEHLKTIDVPMLFIEGTRDSFCPLDTLRKVMRRIPGSAALAVIDGGDHSYKVPKSSGRTTEEAWDEAAQAAIGWLGTL
jgi:predicted alpha/beta-hydrolase family hydrolase